MRIVLIDNFDSFVYNLVDALRAEGECIVLRNTVSAEEVLALHPDLVVLSPGPGHPREAGQLMQILATCLSAEIPVLGICLGFQAIVEHFGGHVERCGPVHGIRDTLRGVGMFDGISVARYHSLGAKEVPAPLEALAWAPSEIGDVVMAARAERVLGLQFHPESILTTTGPQLIRASLDQLLPAVTQAKLEDN